jgi:3-oxoacyl-[acyl-carrier-protein] synthase II
MEKPKRRAVITGLGPITAVGIGRENFWNGLRAEKGGIRLVESFDSSIFNAHCAAEIPDWAPEEFFPPHRLKRLDRYAQFAVGSAKLALADAGLDWSRENPQHRVGVSFGTALGGIANAESEHAHFLKKGSRGVNPGLWRFRPHQYRDRVRFSRRRDNQLEQLRQRYHRGWRGASLYPR